MKFDDLIKLLDNSNDKKRYSVLAEAAKKGVAKPRKSISKLGEDVLNKNEVNLGSAENPINLDMRDPRAFIQMPGQKDVLRHKPDRETGFRIFPIKGVKYLNDLELNRVYDPKTGILKEPQTDRLLKRLIHAFKVDPKGNKTVRAIYDALKYVNNVINDNIGDFIGDVDTTEPFDNVKVHEFVTFLKHIITSAISNVADIKVNMAPSNETPVHPDVMNVSDLVAYEYLINFMNKFVNKDEPKAIKSAKDVRKGTLTKAKIDKKLGDEGIDPEGDVQYSDMSVSDMINKAGSSYDDDYINRYLDGM